MKYFAAIITIVFVAFNAVRIGREIRDGESHFLVSAGGGGLLGHADKYERPLAFWRNIIVNVAIVAAAACFGGWIIFGQSDF